jgi:hypothetical protein
VGVRKLFESWIEADPPAGVDGPAMWSWPIVLSDGRIILTLMWRPLIKGGGKPSGPVAQILEVSPRGEVAPWAPGAGYPAPVIFYAGADDDLWGMDLTLPGKVYACRPDGTHLVTARLSLAMGNLVAPAYFEQRGADVWWLDAGARKRQGKIIAGDVRDVREADELPARDEEVRRPHTHVTRGRVIVLDWDPMGRIGVWEV